MHYIAHYWQSLEELIAQSVYSAGDPAVKSSVYEEKEEN
jgi:hypothetical protein